MRRRVMNFHAAFGVERIAGEGVDRRRIGHQRTVVAATISKRSPHTEDRRSRFAAERTTWTPAHHHRPRARGPHETLRAIRWEGFTRERVRGFRLFGIDSAIAGWASPRLASITRREAVSPDSFHSRWPREKPRRSAWARTAITSDASHGEICDLSAASSRIQADFAGVLAGTAPA
jgi:hypothetical protein